ncbi:hypothetical protein [Microvirga sp. BSC39]|uniref:hypothetical protein n=1 Tax=Microvirga sp. BSC39 TaxID=1549810 RepID=UPI0004E8C21F|nr:hypothetical protein [Microvirga sp. BSC39]KFG69508.1 hypothetical protein JH26_10415 [Microvirga sp. BSC39]
MIEEGDEILVPLDDGESGYALEYTEVEGAIGEAKTDISDLHNTVVEDLALMFRIEDPHGDEKTLSAPITAIYFNPDWDTYDPLVIFAKDEKAKFIDACCAACPGRTIKAGIMPSRRRTTARHSPRWLRGSPARPAPTSREKCNRLCSTRPIP